MRKLSKTIRITAAPRNPILSNPVVMTQTPVGMMSIHVNAIQKAVAVNDRLLYSGPGGKCPVPMDTLSTMCMCLVNSEEPSVTCESLMMAKRNQGAVMVFKPDAFIFDSNRFNGMRINRGRYKSAFAINISKSTALIT